MENGPWPSSGAMLPPLAIDSSALGSRPGTDSWTSSWAGSGADHASGRGPAEPASPEDELLYLALADLYEGLRAWQQEVVVSIDGLELGRATVTFFDEDPGDFATWLSQCGLGQAGGAVDDTSEPGNGGAASWAEDEDELLHPPVFTASGFGAIDLFTPATLADGMAAVGATLQHLAARFGTDTPPRAAAPADDPRPDSAQTTPAMATRPPQPAEPAPGTASAGGFWPDVAHWYDETLHQAAQRNEVATRLHADAQLLRLWGWDGLARWADGAGDGAGTLQYKFGRAFSDDLWGLGQLAVDIGPYGLVNGIAEDLGLPFHQGGPNFNTVAKPFGQTLWAAGKLYQRYLEHDPTLAPEVLGAARTGFGKAYDRYVRPFVDDDPEAGFDHVLGDLGALGGHLAFGVVTDGVGRVAAGRLAPVVSDAVDAANRIPAPGDRDFVGPLPARTQSDRLRYAGRTPGKYSRTGQEVLARMRGEGLIQGEGPLSPGNPNNLKVKGPDGAWHVINHTVDMAHMTDVVSWWNEIGRFFGAKALEVRVFMLDSKNYRLEPQSFNRSAGAKLGQTYLPPAAPSFDAPE
jgi:HNH/ENDO VII superfamily nuclease with conserved GHE residues